MSLPNRPEAASWRGEAEASGESSPSRVSLASAPLASWSRGLLRNERARRRSLVTTTRTPRPHPWRRSSVAASPRRLPLQDAAEDAAHRSCPGGPRAAPSSRRAPPTTPPRAPLRLEVDDPSLDSHPLDVPAPARPRVPVPSSPDARSLPRVDQVPRGGGQELDPAHARRRAVVLPPRARRPPSLSSRSCASRASSSPTRIEPPPSTARRPSTRCRGADDSQPTARGRELVYPPSSSEEARAVARAARRRPRVRRRHAVHPSSNAFTELPNGFDARISPSVHFALAARASGRGPELHAGAALASASR